MKRVSASEARRNWFRLLDEAAAGEQVVIERKGKRLVLKKDEGHSADARRNIQRYTDVLRVPLAEEADQWSWKWSRSAKHLLLGAKTTLKTGRRSKQ